MKARICQEIDNRKEDIINLAKATYRKMVENLAWATGYNIITIPLAAGVLYKFGILLARTGRKRNPTQA